MKDKELVVIRGVMSGSLVCSAGLALVLGIKFLHAGWAAAFLGFAVGTLALRALATRLYRTQRSIDWLLALAVHGCSTHQGRVLADMYGTLLGPDLVKANILSEF